MLSVLLLMLAAYGAYASLRRAHGAWLIIVLLIWSVTFLGLSVLVFFVLPR